MQPNPEPVINEDGELCCSLRPFIHFKDSPILIVFCLFVLFFLIFVLFCFFFLFLVDAESQACSLRDLLLIVGFPVIIIPIITSALLGKLLYLSLFPDFNWKHRLKHGMY